MGEVEMTKGLRVFTGHWQHEAPTKPQRTEEQREREHEATREREVARLR